MKHDELADRIRGIGFSCTRCGACCRGTDADENLVMVTPGEIELLSEGTGQPADRFCEPYPESLVTGGGGSLTFERCLSRTPAGCVFLSESTCTAYPYRPWICRTYPFMLDGDELAAFPCDGLGREMTRESARDLALLLIRRREAEQAEEEAVARVLSSARIPEGRHVIIDGRGIRVI
jgi:Fe-S-cluster containining protein